jgi:DNA-binding response OmpR family regulator
VSSPLTVGGLTVDRLRREVRTGERVIELRAKEFDLLVAFIAHFGQALSRAQILHEVWDFDVPGKTRTVDVHVNHLRPRLAGTGVTIETLRGVGYRLVLSEP